MTFVTFAFNKLITSALPSTTTIASLEISPAVIPKRTLAVEMNQTVLKETIVTKFRNVTKEKNETVNKTVNWLLGFSIF